MSVIRSSRSCAAVAHGRQLLLLRLAHTKRKSLPLFLSSYSLTRRSEKRATREREKKMKKILQKLSVLDGVYFFFSSSRFLAPRQFVKR